ncbi:hypothetical protein TBLA_0B06020 [Henningerozyma blattae CBS 6284]|uniref:Mannosyltransferase n=1 Tax=Henningerozyma blattae (strain ATCC 34711 / CBS 6284 / DSM 70876 / NBRC 10599 / NRRL Y-10934 / UCD 77-7) TaxID=1071380 RepID=I2GZ76_HENB6|nr:hypothetical protein TBLA_0B06020 [Tetrapisispora blattae CBS 6284]CCH59428.1 hypothetical protein TBLA_0B06020 [Tetrapisispora blattae CBS 6284]
MFRRKRIVRHIRYLIEEFMDNCGGTFVLVIVALVITGIVMKDTLSIEYNTYNQVTTYAGFDFPSKRDFPFHRGCLDVDEYLNDPEYTKMNASFVILTRNEEFEGVKRTMTSLEQHFNQWYNYPYVFLNDVEFTQEYKDKIMDLTNSTVEFGTIDELNWEFPEDVRNSFEFKQYIQDQNDRSVMYGGLESYHKMCRFYSGLFYKHPLVQKREWYWRIEPDVEFFCDLTYDPFYEMQRHNKKYGFTIVIPELYWTVPNLFRYTRSYINSNNLIVGSLWKLFTRSYKILDDEFVEEHSNEGLNDWINFEEEIDDKFSEMISVDHLIEFDPDDNDGIEYLVRKSKSKLPIVEDKFNDEEYNMCHFWSNFEIARVDVFDNDIYNGYFQYLEESGGFWKERWGDAPVHSLGLGMTLNLHDVHYFRDIGYRHSNLHHCPRNYEGDGNKYKGQLPYKHKEERFSRKVNSPDWQYDRSNEFGSGCRCRCPNKIDVEDSSYQCFEKWIGMIYFDKDEYNFELDGEWTGKVNGEKRFKQVKKDFLKYKQQEDSWANLGLKLGEAET